MAESLGEVTLQMVNNSFEREADGTVVAVADFQGTAGNFGAVLGTMRFPLPNGPATSGTCNWMGQTFPDNGPWTLSTADGTWEQVEGQNRWKISFPSAETPDGGRIRTEGHIDLATRSFTGQMFDAS